MKSNKTKHLPKSTLHPSTSLPKPSSLTTNLQSYKISAPQLKSNHPFKTIDNILEGQQSGGAIIQPPSIPSAACSQSFVLPRNSNGLTATSSKHHQISGKKINYKNCSNLNICHELSSVSYKNISSSFKKSKKELKHAPKLKRPGTAQSRALNTSGNQQNSFRGGTPSLVQSSLSKRESKQNQSTGGGTTGNSRQKSQQFSVRKYSAQPTQNICYPINSGVNSGRKTNKSLSPPKNSVLKCGSKQYRNERSQSRTGAQAYSLLPPTGPSRSPLLKKDNSRQAIEEIVKESLNKVKMKKVQEDRVAIKEQLKRIDQKERKKILNEQIRTMNKINSSSSGISQVKKPKGIGQVKLSSSGQRFLVVAKSHQMLKETFNEKKKLQPESLIEQKPNKKPNDHGMIYFKIKEELFKKKNPSYPHDSQQASMVQTSSPSKSFYKFEKKENLTPSPQKSRPALSSKQKVGIQTFMKVQKKKIKQQRIKEKRSEIDQRQKMISNLSQLNSYIRKSFKQIPTVGGGMKTNSSMSVLTGRKSSLGHKKVHGSRKSSYAIQSVNKSEIINNFQINNFFSQQAPSTQDQNESIKEFQLFCIYNAAALLIQKHYKLFKQRQLELSVKRNYDYVTFNNKQTHSGFKRVDIPEVQIEKKKVQQHTFSFGNQLPTLSPPKSTKEEQPSFQIDHSSSNMFANQQDPPHIFQNTDIHSESPEIEETPVRISQQLSAHSFQNNMQKLEFKYKKNIQDLVKQQRFYAHQQSPEKDEDDKDQDIEAYRDYQNNSSPEQDSISHIDFPLQMNSSDPAQHFGNLVGSYHPNQIQSSEDHHLDPPIETGALDLRAEEYEDDELYVDGAGASALLESSITEKIIYMSTINSGGQPNQDGSSSQGLNAGQSQEQRQILVSSHYDQNVLTAQDESFVNEIYSQLNREIEDSEPPSQIIENIESPQHQAIDLERESDEVIPGIADFESDEGEFNSIQVVEELYQNDQANEPTSAAQYESDENRNLFLMNQEGSIGSQSNRIIDIISSPPNEILDLPAHEYGSIILDSDQIQENSQDFIEESQDAESLPNIAQIQISKDEESFIEMHLDQDFNEDSQELNESDLLNSDPYRYDNNPKVDIIDQELAEISSLPRLPNQQSLIEQIISDIDNNDLDYEVDSQVNRLNSDGKDLEFNKFIQSQQDEERKFSFSLSENLDDRRSVRSTHGAFNYGNDMGVSPFASANNGNGFYSQNTDNGFNNTTISLFDKNPFKDFTKSMVAGLLDPSQNQYHTDDNPDQKSKLLKSKQQLYRFRKKRNYEIEQWVSTPPQQTKSSILQQNSAPSNSSSSRILTIREEEEKTANSVKQLSELKVGVTERQQELLTLFTSTDQPHQNLNAKPKPDQIDTPTFAETLEEIKVQTDIVTQESTNHSPRQISTDVTIAEIQAPETEDKSHSISQKKGYNDCPPPLLPEQKKKLDESKLRLLTGESLDLQEKGDMLVDEIISNLFEDAFRNHNSCLQKAIYYKRLQKGIKNDPVYISDYVDIIFQQYPDPKEFIQKFLQPIQKDPKEILELLQNMEIGSQVFVDMKVANKEVDNPNSIIPVDFYLDIENAVAQGEQEQSQSLLSNSNLDSTLIEQNNVVTEAQHIHNKAIFDAVNQALDEIRPYGERGEIMPWSQYNRSLKELSNINKDQVSDLCKSKVLNWSKSQAGALPNNEFFVNNFFDEEYFSEYREKKLAHILAQELMEEEKQWLDYELEEAQVKIDLGDMLLEELVSEVTDFLVKKKGPGEMEQKFNTSLDFKRGDSDKTEDSFQV